MKLLISAAALFVIALSGCSSDSGTVVIDESALKSEIMQDATAKDFLITESGAIYIGVLDNGENRDGFARYVCESVRQHAEGSGDRLVKVIDIATASRGDGFKELGSNVCQI